MPEREFWFRLAHRVTGVLAASRDNHIRFLYVDGFHIGTGDITVDLERRVVTTHAWVYGGKVTNYLAMLCLTPVCRRGLAQRAMGQSAAHRGCGRLAVDQPERRANGDPPGRPLTVPRTDPRLVANPDRLL